MSSADQHSEQGEARDVDNGTPPAGVRIANEAESTRKYLILSVSSLLIVFVVWVLLTDVTHTVRSLYFPSVQEVVTRIGRLGWTLGMHAWQTAWRVVSSWAIGCTLGVMMGLAMVRSKIVYYSTNSLIEALRPIPPIALIPFIILWFGLGESGRILLGALTCFMTMVVTTTVAARHVNPVFVRAARSLGASENIVFRSVVLRAIVPQLIAGVRISAALTWAVMVASEYLSAQSGIGFLILQASHTLNTAVVLAGTVVIGLEAFILEQIIRVGADRLTIWVERSA